MSGTRKFMSKDATSQTLNHAQNVEFWEGELPYNEERDENAPQTD